MNIYDIIEENEADVNGLYNYDEIPLGTYTIKNFSIHFYGLEEPNNGRMVNRFRLIKDSVDMTEIATKGGFFCQPIYFPIKSLDSKFIYIPTENWIVLINTDTNRFYHLDYPNGNGMFHNFFWKNYLFIIFNNCLLQINLDNLSTKNILTQKIDFAIPVDNFLIVFSNKFNSLELFSLTEFESISKDEFNINSEELFASEKIEYDKKRLESDKGYLWSTGHKTIGNKKNSFGIHTWTLSGYNLENSTIDIVTTIPVSKGEMDEKRIMWFDVENKYVRINAKVLVANNS